MLSIPDRIDTYKKGMVICHETKFGLDIWRWIHALSRWEHFDSRLCAGVVDKESQYAHLGVFDIASRYRHLASLTTQKTEVMSIKPYRGFIAGLGREKPDSETQSV